MKNKGKTLAQGLVQNNHDDLPQTLFLRPVSVHYMQVGNAKKRVNQISLSLASSSPILLILLQLSFFFMISLSCFEAIVINVSLRCFIALKWLGEAIAFCLVNLNFLSVFSQVTTAVLLLLFLGWLITSSAYKYADSMGWRVSLLFLGSLQDLGRTSSPPVPCCSERMTISCPWLYLCTLFLPMVFSYGRASPGKKEWPSCLEFAFENEPQLFCTVETYK